MIGDALATKFQLTASDWFDDEDHMPLRYRFGYIDDNKREVYFGTSFTTSETIFLPSGILKVPHNHLQVKHITTFCTKSHNFHADESLYISLTCRSTQLGSKYVIRLYVFPST